ncbi:MAG TPA: DUF3052 domain-containing protein [Candidatus Eisenbacteria bacterium]|jgi:hypothetical protein
MPAAAVGYSKRSRLDKLGVKPGMRVAVLGVEERDFVPELRSRTTDIATARPRKDTDLIFLAAEGAAPLARLAALQRSMHRNGAIWVLWPKGQKHITEDLIRGAAIEHGLVDVKVVAFSERLSGLKLVIPRARR